MPYLGHNQASLFSPHKTNHLSDFYLKDLLKVEI
jgi:hypothetical protein